MVSWCPCMVAQARALSRYIPRASGAALCFSKSSTTLVYPVNRGGQADIHSSVFEKECVLLDHNFNSGTSLLDNKKHHKRF